MISQERLRLLTAALRSGDYRQGTGVLHRVVTNDDGTVRAEEWCCLGVAGDVAIRNGLEVARSFWGRSLPFPGATSNEYIDGEATVMSHAVKDWYGFGNRDPFLRVPEGVRPGAQDSSATALNDRGALRSSDWEGPLTFPEIADCLDLTFGE